MEYVRRRYAHPAPLADSNPDSPSFDTPRRPRSIFLIRKWLSGHPVKAPKSPPPRDIKPHDADSHLSQRPNYPPGSAPNWKARMQSFPSSGGSGSYSQVTKEYVLRRSNPIPVNVTAGFHWFIEQSAREHFRLERSAGLDDFQPFQFGKV